MRFETPLRASALAEILGPELLREPLPPACFGLRLISLDSPEKAVAGSLTCIGSRVPVRVRTELTASLALVEEGADAGLPAGLLRCRVVSVHASLAKLLKALDPIWSREKPFTAGEGNHVHPSAVVEGILEGDVTVGPFAYVARDAYIGRGTQLAAHATVLSHVFVGRHCRVQSGAVLGSEGFGFFEQTKGHVEEMPHPAGVVIGDDVFIGAQTVIASGVLHPTWIGRHCKLDSHVQIAHNVELGEGCMLASQSGIAGSTQVGRDLRMGGAASINGHLRLGDKVTVAACSAVTKDLPSEAIVAGFPAKPIQQWRRQEAALRQWSQTLGNNPAKGPVGPENSV
jgi:UDP-3-O-[3-hydroxymyristoyl] glucosamine N-acyltransferase LpxD